MSLKDNEKIHEIGENMLKEMNRLKEIKKRKEDVEKLKGKDCFKNLKHDEYAKSIKLEDKDYIDILKIMSTAYVFYEKIICDAKTDDFKKKILECCNEDKPAHIEDVCQKAYKRLFF